METLYILIPVSFILIALAIAVFYWAVKSGQYDDLEGPAHSILYDDDEAMIPDQKNRPAAAQTAKKSTQTTEP